MTEHQRRLTGLFYRGDLDPDEYDHLTDEEAEEFLRAEEEQLEWEMETLIQEDMASSMTHPDKEIRPQGYQSDKR